MKATYFFKTFRLYCTDESGKVPFESVKSINERQITRHYDPVTEEAD